MLKKIPHLENNNWWGIVLNLESFMIVLPYDC